MQRREGAQKKEPDDRPSPPCLRAGRLSLVNRLLNSPPPALARLPRKYFRSGWAFLIPYLAAYLLYYLTGWPVNLAATAGTGSVVPGPWSAVPSLLHVYWALHAVNIGLALVAFVAWCQEQASREALSDFNTEGTESAEPVVGPDIPSHEEAQKGTKTFLQRFVPIRACRPQPWRRLVYSWVKRSAHPLSPFSSLPPVKSLQEVACFRFPGFPVSRFAGIPLSRFSALLPWLLLALLFYIPGVYMEFPADPWQHYGYINEWLHLDTVAEHTFWFKSGYFLAYSLVGRITPPTRQLFWLDFYYTGCCLLLCWQYFRLARAVGLGNRLAMLFVILQAVMFGNSIFGFYRYYGIATTLFAQIGAVALVRVAIEVASSKIQTPKSKSQRTDAEVLQNETEATENAQAEKMSTTDVHGLTRIGNAALPSARSSREIAKEAGQGVSAFSFLISAFASALALLALIALNHPQGLGIAALGLAAVVIWRLIEWRRSMAWWLAAAALALSVAAVLWWPRNPALDSAYRPGGWLTAWYGFNLFSHQTDFGPGDRTRWIIGLFGLFNLIGGLALLRRNHLVGWLTITPLLALCLPVFAIPLANALKAHNSIEEAIVTFPRMLFAIPSGLAIVCLAAEIANRKFQVPSFKFQETSGGTSQEDAAQRRANQTAPFSSLPPVESSQEIAEEAEGTSTREGNVSQKGTEGMDLHSAQIHAFSFQLSAFPVLLLTLTALLVVPANGPSYNRLWQILTIPPADSTMRTMIALADGMGGSRDIPRERICDPAMAVTPGLGYVLETTGKMAALFRRKAGAFPPAPTTEKMIARLRDLDPAAVRVVPISAVEVLYTPYSLAGFLSGHWLPNDVPLDYATQDELTASASLGSRERNPPQVWLQWNRSEDRTLFRGKGAFETAGALVEDRGSINDEKGFATPVEGDRLTLTPVLRTVDGNGWRISASVTGPDSFLRQARATRKPDLLAVNWLSTDMDIVFRHPGLYAVDILAEVAWPARVHHIHYSLIVKERGSGKGSGAKSGTK